LSLKYFSLIDTEIRMVPRERRRGALSGRHQTVYHYGGESLIPINYCI